MANSAEPLAKTSQPAVSAPTEEYLEAVCRIRDRGEAVRTSTLAREMRVAAPSVVGMLKRMAGQGLLSYARHGDIALTPWGEECAARLRRRHRLAERMLTDLFGMPWGRAHVLACRFEHVIDDEVEPYLLAALQHPTTCPHGNPLIDHAAQGVPLAAVTTARAVLIERVSDESEELLSYLEARRLYPGARVMVLEVSAFAGTWLVEAHGQRHALSREVAERLLVIDQAGDDGGVGGRA